MEKKCSKCSDVKPLELFDKKKGGKFGRRGYCIECRKKQVAKHREDNLDAVKEKRSSQYSADSERIKGVRITHYIENADAVKKRVREYYDNHKEVKSEYNRRYQKENPEIIKAGGQRYRARIRELPNDLSSEQLSDILRKFNGRCALTDSENYHLDHAIPLSSGNGGTTLGNIIPLRSDLNIPKSDGNLFTWFDANRERFALSSERFDGLVSHLAEANGMTTQQYREYYDELYVGQKS